MKTEPIFFFSRDEQSASPDNSPGLFIARGSGVRYNSKRPAMSSPDAGSRKPSARSPDMDRESGNKTGGRVAFRKRNRRKGRGPSAFPRTAPACDLASHIAEAARNALLDLFGPRLIPENPFPLEIKVTVHPGPVWRAEAEPPVEHQIRAAVRETVARAEAYQYGRVYCYRCESPHCGHAVPPKPSCVFAGYAPTGLPRWEELPQVLLELRRPDVDRLYSPQGRDFLTAFLDPELLKRRQLDVFGRQSKTYDILGQIVFGFLDLVPPGSAPAKTERVAMTLQAVESRRADGSARLDLNVLARFADGSLVLDSLSGGSATHRRIFGAILEARQRIASLAPKSSNSRKSLPHDTCLRAQEILQRTARALEHLGRQAARRTSHAEDRPRERRPTSKALEDALAASEEKVLSDVYRRTIVVLGPRNRVHVFSHQGRHVTSLVLDAESVQNRLKRQRWQPMEPEEVRRFRCRAAAHGSEREKNLSAEQEAPRA